MHHFYFKCRLNVNNFVRLLMQINVSNGINCNLASSSVWYLENGYDIRRVDEKPNSENNVTSSATKRETFSILIAVVENAV